MTTSFKDDIIHPLAWRFYGTYANLPLNERNNKILIINGISLSWNDIYEEAQKKSAMAYKAIEKLVRLGILV